MFQRAWDAGWLSVESGSVAKAEPARMTHSAALVGVRAKRSFHWEGK